LAAFSRPRCKGQREAPVKTTRGRLVVIATFAISSLCFVTQSQAERVMDKEAPRIVTVYQVLSESPDSLRMRIVGETRRTHAGEPVVWDLVLLSRDSYCWHRTDWPSQGCTGRVLRCNRPSN